ncbi:hypothetical protein ACRALDRAFT_212502 [Sodiomyces alcalophilus JCM 7366]|uniref:uncharacterized protein n=1 Tax=Sodiomyces alcalophilus JCM 7366 TaxID=591952 RepID=UPI0039B62631
MVGTGPTLWMPLGFRLIVRFPFDLITYIFWEGKTNTPWMGSLDTTAAAAAAAISTSTSQFLGNHTSRQSLLTPLAEHRGSVTVHYRGHSNSQHSPATDMGNILTSAVAGKSLQTTRHFSYEEAHIGGDLGDEMRSGVGRGGQASAMERSRGNTKICRNLIRGPSAPSTIPWTVDLHVFNL